MPRQLIEIAELFNPPGVIGVKNNEHHVKKLNHRFIFKKLTPLKLLFSKLQNLPRHGQLGSAPDNQVAWPGSTSKDGGPVTPEHFLAQPQC